jgi:1-aminocyclopropane-1-carboxylate deaminase/D-cysteine desulfhydrase-like pyridoxal-dependent ACC family enzyme
MYKLKVQNSPVEQVSFQGRTYYIKRDDLLHPFPGNKARKLTGLLQKDWSKISRVVSHGGTQSNAMLAIARLARYKNCTFDYYTRLAPEWLKEHPVGNLKAALALHMQWHETESEKPDESEINAPGTLFIPQGAAMPEAEVGIQTLAQEITDFAKKQSLDKLIVFLPSGTGATALYLQKHLSFPVHTIACVGDAGYLQQQFQTLEPNLQNYPRILPQKQKSPFGKPVKKYLQTWQTLKEQTGIEFDLLYDPPGWLILQDWNPKTPIMVIHCGGVEGNESMLARYRRKKITT